MAEQLRRHVHASELVVSLDKEMTEDWLNVQLFRLNPKHQKPVPEFDSIEVKMK